VGEERIGGVNTETISYNTNNYAKIEQLHTGSTNKDWVYWYNVNGVHDIKVLERVGAKFGLHHLLLEDIANTTQRPKTEFYNNYIFYFSNISQL
jgi:magnesium transporter